MHGLPDDPFRRPPSISAIRNGLVIGLGVLVLLCYGLPWLVEILIR